MEHKRLNFNRPLISARRFSPTVANLQKEARRKNERTLLPSASYKSELHSGPLRNPGTVPFVWEQTPGRPKDETKTQKPPVVPNLPPGRILKPRKQDIDIITQGFYVDMKDSFESSNDSKKEISHLRNDNGNDDDGNGNSRENEKPQLTYGPNFLQLNDHDNEDDSDFDHDEHGNMSFKFCGLLPQFCLKGSIGILNPAPEFSVRTRLPLSSANITRVGASSVVTSQDAAYKPKSSVKQQRDPTIMSTEDTNQRTSQMLEEADNHNESENKEVNIQKKGLVSFKELLDHEKEKEAPTIEKTLYVDTVHKLNENAANVFGISHIPTDSFGFDLFADTSKHDNEMITDTGLCNDPKVDQRFKTGSELPAPPPLPKSPSDSWLWRTLPSVNSKAAASLWSNHKLSSKTTTKLGQNVQSQHPQGLLLPIPET